MTQALQEPTHVEIYADGAVPQNLMEEYEYWDSVIFDGGQEPTPVHWTHPNYFMLLRAGEDWTTAAAIVERTVLVGGVEVPVGGVTTVMTKPQYRRQGFAAQIMHEAVRFIRDDLAVPFGLLLCEPALEGYYAKLSWVSADAGPALYIQPGLDAPRELKAYTVVMYYPCSPDAVWPGGKVDMNGTPW